MLPLLIVILVAGGLLAWAGAQVRPTYGRVITLAALGVDLVLTLGMPWEERGRWLAQYRVSWIPRFGIDIHLAVDEVSWILILLTLVLGMVATLASWRQIQEKVGGFHFSLLLTLAGVIGVFLALDLFLFYFFWELMLVPMFVLILMWGHERRVYASIKFFIFTQLSGLFMLLAILGLVFVHQRQTGELTFDYLALLHTPIAGGAATWLFLGFALAFAVKMPVVPLHTWLPDAHTEAPTAGSVVLAGLLLKTGAYGFLRFAIPLFPDAAATFAPYAVTLGVVGILYGAVLAFAQTDLKRLVAYSSVSHLGFVLVGLFSWNLLALQGVLMQMICHGLSTGGLFVLAGVLQERTGTRDLGRLGGLWAVAPRMGAIALILAMASLGLPGLGNFVGEFPVLLGAFQDHPIATGFAVLGLVFAAIYSLWLIQRTFHGKSTESWSIDDASGRELAVFGVTIVLLLWLGLHPQPFFDAAEPALTATMEAAPKA